MASLGASTTAPRFFPPLLFPSFGWWCLHPSHPLWVVVVHCCPAFRLVHYVHSWTDVSHVCRFLLGRGDTTTQRRRRKAALIGLNYGSNLNSFPLEEGKHHHPQGGWWCFLPLPFGVVLFFALTYFGVVLLSWPSLDGVVQYVLLNEMRSLN